MTTIEGQPFRGLNPKAGFHKAREIRAFEAAHENVRHMVEIVKVMRRINDDLDVIRHQPQKPKEQGRDHSGNDAAAEVIYVAGLGDCWERHLLADRYRLSDSDFWMFNTGRVKRLNRKRTWMTRIAFDPQAKTTLVLTMQDRQVLQGLPGGLRMLQMWDQLWEA